MKVKDIISKQPLITIAGGQSLGDACDVFEARKITGAPVVDAEGRLLGILTSRQILHFAHVGVEGPRLVDPDWHSPVATQPARGVWRQTPVSNCMIRDVATVGPETEISVAAALLLDRGVHRAVVVDDRKKPVATITSMDFTRLIATSREGQK